jgi:hypothetical protein
MQFQYTTAKAETIEGLRCPKALSYTALKCYESMPEEFYVRYLAPDKTPRPAQEPFMAVGSAFDALIKNRIYIDIHGKAAVVGTPYEMPLIMETQVEEEFRYVAIPVAADLFKQYVDCGAYDSLLADIKPSTELGMEFTVTKEVGGVPLLGKPDLRFVTEGGLHLITDFKVNGSMSKTGASPQAGYRMCHDYGSNTHGKAHKRFVGKRVRGVLVSDVPMDVTTDYWAEQLAMYAWLCGEPVGSQNFVVRIEQIACRPVKTCKYPRAKFAQHVAQVSEEAQHKLLERLQACWRACQTGHVFPEMTLAENNHRLLSLKKVPIDFSKVFSLEHQ